MVNWLVSQLAGDATRRDPKQAWNLLLSIPKESEAFTEAARFTVLALFRIKDLQGLRACSALISSVGQTSLFQQMVHGAALYFQAMLKGDTADAQAVANKLIKDSNLLCDLDSQVEALQFLATSLTMTSEFERAITVYLEAIKLASRSNNLSLICSLKGNIAVSFFHAGDVRTALTCSEEAYDISTEIADLGLRGVFGSNYALYNALLGDIENAQTVIEEVLPIAEIVGGNQLLARCYGVQGIVSAELAISEKSVNAKVENSRLLKKALDEFGLQQEMSGGVGSLTNLTERNALYALCLHLAGFNEKGLEYAGNVIDSCEDDSTPEGMRDRWPYKLAKSIVESISSSPSLP